MRFADSSSEIALSCELVHLRQRHDGHTCLVSAATAPQCRQFRVRTRRRVVIGGASGRRSITKPLSSDEVGHLFYTVRKWLLESVGLPILELERPHIFDPLDGSGGPELMTSDCLSKFPHNAHSYAVWLPGLCPGVWKRIMIRCGYLSPTTGIRKPCVKSLDDATISKNCMGNRD